MDWERWGQRLLVGGAAIVTGAFARMAYDRKVRQLGRRFEAGGATGRGGRFACEACGAAVPLAAGAVLPACGGCGASFFTKID